MVERSTEVLPHWKVRAGVVGREKQPKHVNQPEEAGHPASKAKEKTEADEELAVGHHVSNRECVRQDVVLEYGDHERISTILKKAVDPKLEAAAANKAFAENLVLAKDQEQQTHKDTNDCDGARVASDGRGSFHV